MKIINVRRKSLPAAGRFVILMKTLCALCLPGLSAARQAQTGV